MAQAYYDGEYPGWYCEDALDDFGYVLAFNTATGKLKKATDGDLPFGIAYHDTKDLQGNAQANRRVAVVMTGIAYVKVETGDGETISPGDYIGTKGITTPGYARKMTFDTTDASTLLADLKKVVGIALDSVAEGTKTTIRVLLWR